ncbi:hypothetical protein Tco_1185494 [Tanacetum coccineum]
MQQKIKRLQAQLGDQTGKNKDTPCVSNTLDHLSQKLENENVELEFQIKNYAKISQILSSIQEPLRAQLFDKVSEQKDTTCGTSANTKFVKQSILGKPPSSSRPKLYVVTPLPKSMAIPKVGETNALIDPRKTSRKDNFMPNKHVKASVRTKPITVSQSHVITKNDENSQTNCFSPKDVKSATRTRRSQPRNNPKNNKVLSKSKSSWLSNNLGKIEENHRNLQSSSTLKYMSSERNNIRLVIRNSKSEVVCAMCKQCLITINHDACVLNYVNDMNSRALNKNANVSNVENQKKYKPKVWKPKKVGSKERLASFKPSTPRSCLRWSPTGRIFDLKGKIITTIKSECQSDCFKGDNACTSNPLKPTSKRFPNSTFSMIDALVTRTTSAAAKPCQGDSFELYLITVNNIVNVSQPKGKFIKLNQSDVISIPVDECLILGDVIDIFTIPNLHFICAEEGFPDIDIHYILLASLFVLGHLRLTKKSNLWGTFLFSDEDSDACLSNGRVCIKTHSISYIKDQVLVEIGKDQYSVFVKEISKWTPIIKKPTEEKNEDNAEKEENDKVASDNLCGALSVIYLVFAHLRTPRASRHSLSLQMSLKSLCSSSGTLSRRSKTQNLMNSFWPTRSAKSMLKFLERFLISVQELKENNSLRLITGRRRNQAVKLCHSLDSQKLKFIRIGEDYQEYGLPIPDMMLNDKIKQSESYQIFIKYSTSQIPPKKSIGKGSQGKKTADVSQESIDVSEESKPKPAKKKTSSRSTKGVIIQDTPSTPKLKPAASKLKLKGVQSLTPEEQEAADNMQELKESKKTSKRQPGTEGSSEGTGRLPGVPDESTVISATSSKGTGTKPGVPYEEKVTSEANVILEWGLENKSEHSDDSKLNFNDKEKKDNDGDADDEGDDHISDIQDIDDEDAETESDEDEIYKYKIHVRKDVDVDMAEAKTIEHENKEKDVLTDAAKPDVEKIVEEKGDAELDENAMASNYQVKESTEFPMPSSSLSVSSGFETLQIQSPSIQKVHVLVILETTTLSPVPKIPTKTLVSTILSPPHITPTISSVHQTTTPIPTPPIITDAPTITTVVPESDAFTTVQLKVAKLEKDVSELKKIDLSAKALATLKSQVLTVVDDYLGSKFGDALQKTLQKHSADLF